MPTSVISGTLLDPSGTPVAGATITATIVPKGSTRISDSTEIATVEQTTTDGSGNWSLTLEETANVYPANSYYKVVEQISQGNQNIYAIQVPAANVNVNVAKVEYVSPSAPEFAFDSAEHAGTDHTAIPGVLDTAEHALIDHEALPGVLSLTEHNASNHNGVPGVVQAVPITFYDAKGDIVIGSADNAAGKLSAGPDGQFLTTDSTQATGTKWTDHTGAADPHPGYLTPTEGNAAYDPIGSSTAAVSTHAGLADPHTGYQKESEKDQNNGYAGLDGSGLVPDVRIAATIARDSEVTTAITDHEGAANPHTGYATDTDLSTHAGAADPHTGYVLESLIDAKGDLIVGSAADTVGRLAPTTDTHVLTLDSAQALGMKWAAPSGGGATIIQQPDAPSSPVLNDLWIDTDEGAETGLSSIIGYTESLTLNQVVTTSQADLTGMSVTVTVPAGRRLRIKGFCFVKSDTADARSGLYVIRGSSPQIQGGFAVHPAINKNNTIEVEAIDTPSAGAVTYKLSGIADPGNSTFGATTGHPAYILVEDITGTLWPAGQSIGVGAIASEEWTDFTPSLVQSGAVTYTDTYSKYQRIGRTIHAQVNLSVTGTGTAANDIVVGIPVPAAAAGLMVGSGIIYDSSTGLVYPGIVEINAGQVTVKMRSTVVGGTNPTFLGSTSFTAALASGDLVRYHVTYEAAA